MQWGRKGIRLGAVLLLFPLLAFPQEETESAELTLEAYTDAFQECFFEALKQKGIENYDKAINILLQCRELTADKEVVDHELARAYLANRQYVNAQDYALRTLNSQTENPWILKTLLDVLAGQGRPLESLGEQVPMENPIFRKNLALSYFQRNDYTNAQNILKGLQKDVFTEQLARKISDSIARQQALGDMREAEEKEENPLLALREELEALASSQNYQTLETKAETALESYPTQPWLYYLYGSALHKNGKTEQATGILETGLDFLLDDNELRLKIYNQLVEVYTALGNTSKANMYLSKIKSGS